MSFLATLLARLGLIALAPVRAARPQILSWREGDSYTVTDNGLHRSVHDDAPTIHHF